MAVCALCQPVVNIICIGSLSCDTQLTAACLYQVTIYQNPTYTTLAYNLELIVMDFNILCMVPNKYAVMAGKLL